MVSLFKLIENSYLELLEKAHEWIFADLIENKWLLLESKEFVRENGYAKWNWILFDDISLDIEIYSNLSIRAFKTVVMIWVVSKKCKYSFKMTENTMKVSYFSHKNGEN